MSAVAAEHDVLERHLRGVPGWLSDEEATALYELAKGCTGRGVIVEIGSFKGRSTICLGLGSQAGRSVPIYAIDPGHGWKRFAEFQANIRRARIEALVTPIAAASADAFPDFPEPAIELLFIDGSHRYDLVDLDFHLWTRKLLDGGMLAMHDTNAYFPGSCRVAEEQMYKGSRYRHVRFIYSSMTIGRRCIASPSRSAPRTGRGSSSSARLTWRSPSGSGCRTRSSAQAGAGCARSSAGRAARSRPKRHAGANCSDRPTGSAPTSRTARVVPGSIRASLRRRARIGGFGDLKPGAAGVVLDHDRVEPLADPVLEEPVPRDRQRSPVPTWPARDSASSIGFGQPPERLNFSAAASGAAPDSSCTEQVEHIAVGQPPQRCRGVVPGIAQAGVHVRFRDIAGEGRIPGAAHDAVGLLEKGGARRVGGAKVARELLVSDLGRPASHRGRRPRAAGRRPGRGRHLP